MVVFHWQLLPVLELIEKLTFQFSPSILRRQQDSIAGSKYEGVKTSRKQLMDDTDSEKDANEYGGDSDSTRGPPGEDEEATDDEGHSEEFTPTDSDNDDHQGDQKEQIIQKASKRVSSQEPPDDLSSTLKQKRDEDHRKGKTVSRQLVGSQYTQNSPFFNCVLLLESLGHSP